MAGRKPTHGKSDTRVYKAWVNMRQRCDAANGDWFDNYAARGIGVCDEWQSFEAFYAAMGDPPSPLHTLERKNNDLGYQPGNCVWATRLEQARNRRSNINVYSGESLAERAKAIGIPYPTLRKRLSLGWSMDRALSQPLRPQR